MIRHCKSPTWRGTIHLFEEGSDSTLCGRDCSRWQVKPDAAFVDCRKCLAVTYAEDLLRAAS